MAENETNQKLNRLLINLGRSLLQYVGEAWPWTQADAQREQEIIDRLVARQQTQIAELTEVLVQRNWAIDFGSYPTQYTDLHYVALDYLLSQIVANEETLLDEIEESLKSCSGDAVVTTLLERLRDGQTDIVSELKDLVSSRASGSAA